MSTLRASLAGRLARELEDQGLQAWAKRLKRHCAVVFVWRGRPYQYVVPGSESDRRTEANCRAGIRRKLRQLGYE